ERTTRLALECMVQISQFYSTILISTSTHYKELRSSMQNHVRSNAPILLNGMVTAGDVMRIKATPTTWPVFPSIIKSQDSQSEICDVIFRSPIIERVRKLAPHPSSSKCHTNKWKPTSVSDGMITMAATLNGNKMGINYFDRWVTYRHLLTKHQANPSVQYLHEELNKSIFSGQEVVVSHSEPLQGDGLAAEHNELDKLEWSFARRKDSTNNPQAMLAYSPPDISEVEVTNDGEPSMQSDGGHQRLSSLARD
ncbi:15192_t:CDS:2, partial [Acaulospora colombiana]